MGSVFRFKKFEVDQSGCAMKINTDGVLLAAVVVHSNPRFVLDIGTGTGVIALMLAQRFPDADIDAVEIDESAAKAATGNFARSAFSERTTAHFSAIEDYKTDRKYDLIVSNPPYFVNDLKNPEIRKGIARHADAQFFESLLIKVAEILSDGGCFWVILPVKQAELLVQSAVDINLFLRKQIDICSDEHKPVIRQVICLSGLAGELERETFYIYESEGVYTAAYRTLLKDFFLAF
ncbi:tRNA1Val (adenine37-N6)-methyltransferase [Pedobacter caeni]|uniref:tRNA1(Val) (adenine(37)-N6)-methyltransferase n=2 Tax=Pedobacter caeni TaxID=288992 RepID=A0A1M5B0A7_9SPHI|nr:tRNA1Val (adenine37-N6)-methyltransferase [Pedobacter caeni]